MITAAHAKSGDYRPLSGTAAEDQDLVAQAEVVIVDEHIENESDDQSHPLVADVDALGNQQNDVYVDAEHHHHHSNISHEVPQTSNVRRGSRSRCHRRRRSGCCRNCCLSCGICVLLVVLFSLVSHITVFNGQGFLSCAGQGACEGNTGKIAAFSW